MNQEKLKLYRFAKLANEELLLEGLLQTKGLYPMKFLEKYKKKPNHFKIRVVATKILYSLIFGILPLLPILTYFQIVENLIDGRISVETIIFTGSVFFGLYFALQFFNFFLMCILESGMIMSGSIFTWFKTLPISREKLNKMAYLTMFRSFDIPIIVIILGFPITMLIGTQNLIIFFVCLGISILNILFSFDIVILLGKRLNRILDFNVSSSKKALTIRLINILSYPLIILSSVYVIQWSFGNIETIFLFVIEFEQAAFVNLILSIIPYPFNPSFLVSLVIIPMEITIALWVSTIIGLGLFVLLTWWIHSKTSKMLEEITYQESTNGKKDLVKNEIHFEIKTHSPLSAFLRKDLSIATHDLKTFMAIIMPIILSCIFTFSFNAVYIFEANVIEREIFLYSVGILIFCPIISGMLVYGISNIEVSGESVTASLPIDPREQAKAKIILLIIFQTLTVFAPLLLYVTNSKFTIFLLASLVSLPFSLIILILTFEMKILFFGKFRNSYKIEDINPENRTFKWTLIISLEYILVFWIISFAVIFGNTFNLLIFYIGVTFVGALSAIFIFNKILPILPEIDRISKVIPHIKNKEVKWFFFKLNQTFAPILFFISLSIIGSMSYIYDFVETTSYLIEGDIELDTYFHVFLTYLMPSFIVISIYIYTIAQCAKVINFSRIKETKRLSWFGFEINANTALVLFILALINVIQYIGQISDITLRILRAMDNSSDLTQFIPHIFKVFILGSISILIAIYTMVKCLKARPNFREN